MPDSRITRCPNCTTSFRVTWEQLAAAQGMVRCGACLQVFLANEHLLDESGHTALSPQETQAAVELFWDDFERYAPLLPPAQVPRPETLTVTPEEPATSTTIPFRDARIAFIPVAGGDDEGGSGGSDGYWETGADNRISTGASFTDAAENSTNEGDSPGHEAMGAGNADPLHDVPLPDVAIDEVVAEITSRPAGRALQRAGWALVALLAVGGLLAQYGWREMGTLSLQPTFRPYYEQVCALAGCRLPDYVNLDAMRTSNLVVRTHPDIGNALQIDALIRNEDVQRQPFPNLLLEFTNIRDEVVAARRFDAAEYLAGEMKGMRYIPGRTEVRFSLAIDDPGKNALGYRLQVVPGA